MSNHMLLDEVCEQLQQERRSEAEAARVCRGIPSRRRSDPALWLSLGVAIPYVGMLVYFVWRIASATGAV